MFKALFGRVRAWTRRHRVLSMHLLILLSIILSVLMGYSIYTGIKTAQGVWMENKSFVANLIIAVEAHKRAGEPILFKPDYTHNETFWVWDMFETNSYWVADYTFKIVPMLVNEEVTTGIGIYPKGVGFSPYGGIRSLRVAGTAYPMFLFVYLNERYITDDMWVDEGDALRTLVHELVHLQGGKFINGNPESYEAHTQAAMIEVTAAMCNQGDQVACKAFWGGIEHMARTNVMWWFIEHGWEAQYQTLANILFRDPIEERAARKSVRYWANHKIEERKVIKAYYVKPWEELIVPGIVHQYYELDTGIPDWTMSGYYIGMPFDDAKDLLSGLLKYFKWIE